MSHMRRVAVLLVSASVAASSASAAEIVVHQDGATTNLSLDDGPAFHSTADVVSDVGLIVLPGSTALLAIWNETLADGSVVPYQAVSPDGVVFSPGDPAQHELALRPSAFDPLAGVPEVPGDLAAGPDTNVYIVQFATRTILEMQQAVAALGATRYHFLPHQAFVVRMPPGVREEVAALPFVRWVGPLHPAYRLEPYLRDNLTTAAELSPSHRYNMMVFEPGLAQKTVVAERIAQIGGTVDAVPRNGYVLQATLTPAQVLVVIAWDEISWMDRWSPPGSDMDVARDIGGALFLRDAPGGFTGEGVIGEVMDEGFQTDPIHAAFFRCVGGTSDGAPCTSYADCPGGGSCDDALTIHGEVDSDNAHGTSVLGCVFGAVPGGYEGRPDASGVLPDARGVFADRSRLEETGCDPPAECVDRYCHTCELVDDDCTDDCPVEYDPTGSYDAVFQTNSWGTGPSLDYQADSAAMDDILFKYDLTICQSHGNFGVNSSRRQAWAKNIVSVGGVYHLNTLATDDDSWGGEGADDCALTTPASHGPAEDGRIKPDFANFYDQVLTTDNDNTFNDCFGGTSAATPITCGYFGLFYEMWSTDHFGTSIVPNCDPQTMNCVFVNRPHMTTAKAMMINTSRMYDFTLPPPDGNPDLTRDKQGWGLVDVGKLYVHGVGDKFPLIVNEIKVIGVQQAATYTVTVPTDAFELKVTMVYADPMGNPACPEAYINDLNLRVRSPSGVNYWGNTGLNDGNWSESGGGPNSIAKDTVENVFVESPDAGQWKVRVTAAEINEDGHVETPLTDDADFALVVSVDFDCNSTGYPDSYDIARGDSVDANNNGIPAECDDE